MKMKTKVQFVACGLRHDCQLKDRNSRDVSGDIGNFFLRCSQIVSFFTHSFLRDPLTLFRGPMVGKHRIIQMYTILHKVELLNIPLGNSSPQSRPFI